MIEEELEDACKYVKAALLYKTDRQSLAQTFYSLSMDEMKHFNILHDEVVKAINEYKSTGAEVPADMQAVYDYVHKKHIEKAGNIKILMDAYRE